MSSLQKRCTFYAPYSQMPIPDWWKIVHCGHCDAQKEMGDGVPLIPQPGLSGDQEL